MVKNPPMTTGQKVVFGGGLAAGSVFGGNPYFALGGALLGGMGGMF